MILCRAGVEKVHIDLVILTNGSALINKTYFICNWNGSTDQKIILPYAPKGYVLLRASQRYEKTRLGLLFDVFVSPRSCKKIVLTYFKRDFVYQLGRENFVLFDYEPYYPTNITIALPKASVIIKCGNDLFLSPRPTKISSDGLRIILTYENVTKPMNFIIGYRTPPKINLYLLVIILIIGFIVILLILYLIKEVKIKLITSMLTEEELVLVKYILSKGNKVRQKELYENLDFSKAKISRLLQDLESRNIIERKTVKKEKIIRVKI